MEKFVVYQSKLKQVGLSLLGLLMVGASFAVCAGSLAEGSFLFSMLGIIGLIFFGFCAFFLIKQVFKSKPIIILNSEGFYDYSSALSAKKLLISWKDISKIEETSMLNQEFVSVYLKQPEEFLAKLSSFQRKAVQANIRMGFGEINITLQSAKHCTNEQLCVQMNRYLSLAKATVVE
jgi:hypothetical protein